MKILSQTIITLLCLLVVGWAFGWVNPSAAPFGGAGIISSTATGVGIGVASPAYALDISGNVQWSGTLTAGNVPWVRLDAYPTGCPAGRLMIAIGSILTCANPAWSYLTNIPAGFADGIDNVSAGTGVTSLSAGAGVLLSPNPITGAGSVTLDPNYSQRRVTGSCGATGSIRVINVDGTVVCQTF